MGWREEYEQAIAKTEASSPVNAELADTCVLSSFAYLSAFHASILG